MLHRLGYCNFFCPFQNCLAEWSRSNLYAHIKQRICVNKAKGLADQHIHEIWWRGEMHLLVLREHNHLWEWWEERFWEAKFYLYYMHIISLCREEGFKEGISVQKEQEKVLSWLVVSSPTREISQKYLFYIEGFLKRSQSR